MIDTSSSNPIETAVEWAKNCQGKLVIVGRDIYWCNIYPKNGDFNSKVVFFSPIPIWDYKYDIIFFNEDLNSISDKIGTVLSVLVEYRKYVKLKIGTLRLMKHDTLPNGINYDVYNLEVPLLRAIKKVVIHGYVWLPKSKKLLWKRYYFKGRKLKLAGQDWTLMGWWYRDTIDHKELESSKKTVDVVYLKVS